MWQWKAQSPAVGVKSQPTAVFQSGVSRGNLHIRGANLHNSALRHGLLGVQRHIQDDLPDLSFIDKGLSQIGGKGKPALYV